MAMTEWHGYRIEDKALHIGPWPDRKRIALYWTRGNLSNIVAYFKSEAQAAEVLAFLDKLVSATEVLWAVMNGLDNDWQSEDGWCIAGCGFLLDRPDEQHTASCPLVKAKALLKKEKP